ncbi:MAG: amino acid permease [Candidatus Delongbacteria bacterium]|nr:amino acid permease [Candidatus Delongbacteria bacterium]
MTGKKLHKELGLLDIFCISSGAMISSGLFILPGLAYVQAGPGMILSYMIAGMLALTGLMSQAELVSAMPKAGGDYFFITRSMGPAVGTINGLIVWFSISLKSAFALIGMAAFTQLIINIDVHIIALILCLFFLFINIAGVKEASRFQVFIVISLIALILFFVFSGLNSVNVNNFSPFASQGILSIFSTAGLVFVSYGGLLKVASVAEEARNPTRTVPLGMILSLVIVGILYALVIFVTTGILGDSLGTSVENATLTPITDAARISMGNFGFYALSVAAILAFVSTANAGIMSASRYLLALSRDKLIPSFFSKMSKRSYVPIYSILFTSAFMVLSLFLKLDVLIKAASTVMIITYIFSSLAVVVLRESKVQNYQPKFKSPLYPWIQIISITGFSFLVFEMGIEAILTALALAFIGFAAYWFYGKKNSEKEYAILSLIERITNREFVTFNLENELKDIIRERDEIIKDRFDHIIEECSIADIDERLSCKDLFSIIASHISPKLNIDRENVEKLLIQRENDNSTALTDFIAIPHIIIEGTEKFDIFLYRGKNGFVFTDNRDNIKAVFVLLGTKDQRNFHLRAISAIAQIVQDPDFKERWENAKTIEHLRDIVLLGKRIR